MSDLKKTTDYRIFKHGEMNRRVDPVHVRRLCASILQKDMLEYRPLLVNKSMQVVDGQHRLLAAQELGLPVYYQVIDDYNQEDLIMLAQVSSKWSIKDYVDHFSRLGKPAYIVLAELLNKLKIKAATIFMWAGHRKHRAGSDVKSGRLEEISLETIECLQNINETYLYLKQNQDKKVANIFESRSCQYALRILSFSQEVNFDKLLDKIKRLSFLMKRRATVEDALIDLVNIYNYKSSKDNISIVKGKEGLSITSDDHK